MRAITEDTGFTFRPATLDEIYQLRFAVLRPGHPPQRVYFPGDDAPSTRHFGAFAGARNVGCLTLIAGDLDDAPAWQLRGMATDPAYQRQGIGGRLLGVAEAALQPRPAVLWCNARVAAVPFYRRHGWSIFSEEFNIVDVGPHFRMKKLLP